MSIHQTETEAPRRVSGKEIALVLLITVGAFVFQQLASILGGRVADVLNNRAVDPDNAFLWLCIHHIVQLALALLVIALLGATLKLDFHIKPAMNASGARMVAIFCGAMCVYAVLYYWLGYRLGMLIPFGYPSTPRNVIGSLGFQLLLSGPAEELMFRALPVTLLLRVLRRHGRRGVIASVLIASLLFSIAHINWYTDPFRLSFYWYQLGYAFILGVIYGLAYERRGSVLYPMLLHSMSNVIVFSFGYVFYALV